MKKRLISLLVALSLVLSLVPVTTVPAGASTTPPTVKAAKLVTNSLIEIDWQGTDYINGAGRSKENTSAVHNNFEVMLNGTRLNLNSSVPSWYWNINNLSLHGVRVNQNKTTLRLASNLTTAQMTAVQNGTSTLTVRITGGVTASTLSGTTGNGANSASNIGAPGAAANTTTLHPVVYKPYYDKTVVTKTGITIKGSEFVLQSTVQRAADMVDTILSAAPKSLTDRMATTNQFAIFGPGEHSYNIPEHRNIFLNDNWNRAEGYGGSLAATSAANVERNHALPAAQRPYDSAYASGYRNESILAHEFGHGILNPGMNNNSVVNAGAPANTSMRSEHIAIWTASRATPENPNTPTGRKLWDGATIGTGTYMSKNSDEFMATAVAIWFDAMAGSNSWSNDGYGMVCTRDQLRRYDTPFYNFLSRTLPETKILSDAWASNATNTNPYIHPKPAEPTGRWGPSIKIKSAMTIANNPAGSGIQMYIPFNAAANTITNAELWWDIDTDIMRWYLEPDATESYFRINKKMGAGYTQNAQRDNLVLMPNNSSATSGANIVLAQRNTSDESQWWAFNKQTNGTFIITNKSNPALAITLVGDATAKGTRIALGSATSAASRFWRLDGGTLPIMSDAPPPTTYTVTFNPNGGSVTPTSAVTGTNGRLTSLPTPTRNGYSFSGWFTDATGGASVTTGTVYSANTTIFARWTANSTTVATTATTTVATTTPIATTSQSTSASTSVSTSTSQSVSVSTSSSATVSSPTSSLTTASTTSSITTSASVTTSDSTASTASTSSESTSTSTSTDTTTSTSSQPTTTTSQSTTTTSQSTTTTSQTTTTTSQSTTTASLPTLTTSQSTTTTTTSQSTTTTSQPTTSQPTTTTMSQPTITTPMATSAPATETSDETSATTEAEEEPRLIGDVDCNGSVTINDALEILKFLAKLSSEIDQGGNNRKNAIILGGESPTINDALEILKFLAKLESLAGVWTTDN